MAKTKESHPLTSYTLGILSVAISLSSMVGSVVGLVLGITGLVKNKNKGIEYAHTSKILNIVGIVIGGIGTALLLVALIVTITGDSSLTGQAVTQPPAGL